MAAQPTIGPPQAEDRAASRLYWHTQEFSADGRALHDTLARRTSFIVHER